MHRLVTDFFHFLFFQTIDDKVADSEQIPDNESEDLDYELAVDDAELLLDLDAGEAIASDTTKIAEVTATEEEPEINEVENEVVVENDAEPPTEECDDENAAIDKELNEEYEEDDAADDFLSLDVEEDGIFGDDDVTKR